LRIIRRRIPAPVVDGVRRELNRPSGKPLTSKLPQLTDFFLACAFDDRVKVIVVTGAGATFCPAATCSRSSDP